MSISRFTTLFAIIYLISPITCLAQSEFSEGRRAAATPKNAYVVSVQELRMSDKGRKAFEKGVALLEKGDAAASLAYFDRAIAEFPGFYQAHYQLGIAHFRLGHTIEAEQAFQKSIDLTGGGYAPPEFGMGMVLCQKQELERAETVVQPFKSLLAPAQTPLADTAREARDPPTGRVRASVSWNSRPVASR
jgi:tetratricopeptide (TPR) repeat protein